MTMEVVPLLQASQKGRTEIVDLLLQYGADVNTKDSDGNTALYWAALKNHVGVFRRLCKHPNIQITELLHKAADKGFAKIIQHVCRHKNLAINGRDDQGFTPLAKAAQRNHTDVACKLCQHPRADVNAATNSGDAPLHFAARHGNMDVVRTLCQSMADVNQANNAGETPIFSPASRSQADMVHLLCALYGADVNYMFQGKSPLTYLLLQFTDTAGQISEGKKQNYCDSIMTLMKSGNVSEKHYTLITSDILEPVLKQYKNGLILQYASNVVSNVSDFSHPNLASLLLTRELDGSDKASSSICTHSKVYQGGY